MGLFDIFGTGDQQAAANAQIAGINQGLTGLTSAVNQGSNDLTTNYSSALLPFMQNYGTATSGTTALSNALGLNGTAGNAAATAAFWNNPGTQAQLTMGNNAITAADAASGKTGSGNEAMALANYDQGLVGQNWNTYLGNLQPFLNAGNAAAQGIGMVDMGLGNQLNNNQTTIGNANYGASTSIGNANANAQLAGLNASANALGAIGGLGSALFSFL